MQDEEPKPGIPGNDSLQLTAGELSEPVVKLLNHDTAEIGDCSIASLSGGTDTGTAIYRVSGSAHDGHRIFPWRLILKVLHPQGEYSQPDSFRYYRREAEIYESGLLDRLTDGLGAPRVYGVADRPDGSCHIWLEDVQDDMGTTWPLEHYGVVARHLGRFNGLFLTDRSLTGRPYLSRGWLRAIVEEAAPAIELLRASTGHPLVRRLLANGADRVLFRLWEDRHSFFDVLDGLPQTFCHLDAFRRNIMARKSAAGCYDSILFDWAFSGIGAIGADIAPLVFASIMFFEVTIDQFGTLEQYVLSGYLAGLADVGCRLDPRRIRLGYAAASLRFQFAGLGFALETLLDQARHDFFPQIFGHSVTEVIDHSVAVCQLIGRLTAEVAPLLDELG